MPTNNLKSRFLVIAIVAFSIILACFRIVAAVWQEPSLGCEAPDCNRQAPLYKQLGAQEGPLNLKDMVAGSGNGTIEANKYCLCDDVTGNCSADKCISSWVEQGIWSKDRESLKVYYNDANVGIGTTTPGEKLEINDASDGIARLRITDTAQNPELQIQYGTGGGDHWAMYNSQTNDDLRIWGGGADRLTILQNGNVGIGTSNPSYALEVEDGTAYFGGNVYMGNMEFSENAGLAAAFDM
ncbi:MAG: hypothetical protein V1655_00815, partial [bacterium]